MMRYGYGMMGYDYGLGFLLFFLVIGLTIFIIYLHLHNSKTKEPKGEGNAISILNERLARGEISEEEYVKVKEILLKK